MLANAQTGFVVDANEKACELLGYDRSELIGLHQTQLHPPEDFEFVRSSFREFAITQDYHSLECNLLHRSGRFIPVMITGSSPFQIGDEIFTAGHFKDLSKVKEAESTIVSKMDLLKSAERISNTGSIEINLLTGERYWSDQFYRILGYEPQEMAADRWFLLSMFIPMIRMDLLNGRIRPLPQMEVRERFKSGYSERISKREIYCYMA